MSRTWRACEALLVPETGIVDFRRVARARTQRRRKHGGEIVLGRARLGDRAAEPFGAVRTARGREITAQRVVTCAGLHSDRVAALSGDRADADRIVPFRGDYYTLAPARTAARARR